MTCCSVPFRLLRAESEKVHVTHLYAIGSLLSLVFIEKTLIDCFKYVSHYLGWFFYPSMGHKLLITPSFVFRSTNELYTYKT